MKTILCATAILAVFFGCEARDTKVAMATVWHAGKALKNGCKRPDLVGDSLMKLAQKHAEKFKYEIDKEVE